MTQLPWQHWVAFLDTALQAADHEHKQVDTVTPLGTLAFLLLRQSNREEFREVVGAYIL